MIHLYIRNPSYTILIRGIKKYELRLFKGIFKHIKIGDTVYLCNRDMGLSIKRKVTVTNLIKFPDFEQLLLKLNTKECIVQYSDIEKGLKYMNSIYSSTLQKKHNCIAIAFTNILK